MPNLRQQITSYLTKVAVIVMALLLGLFVFFQIRREQETIRRSAEELFYQIEQILRENRRELESVQEQYRESTLHRAETIAEILGDKPADKWGVEELSRIAAMVEVDEIHLFDKNGVIVAGTVPEYYGYSFDDGEQIGFFKPLLTDKSLRLAQEITPNTAVSMPMQYSALWNKSGSFIVQVGMYPANVLKVTEKNELSYIFSLLRANNGVDLYAADPRTGEIRGATGKDKIGKTLDEIGISLKIAESDHDGFRAVVDGVSSYCFFTELDRSLIGYVESHETAHHSIAANTGMMAAGLLLVACLMVLSVTYYMDKYVIQGVRRVNEALKQITRGDLETDVDIRSSLEFSELSDHINAMVKSLLSSTRKISFILNQTDLNIGVYEYSENMDRVRYTEHVPQILAFATPQNAQYGLGREAFRAIVDSLRSNPVEGEEGIYSLRAGDSTRYIRLEEISEGSETTGIVMDETEEVRRRQEIEKQRDLDPLTGILNRRGLDSALSELFRDPDKVRHSAIVMVDADGLKTINDSCGHFNGDLYIRGVVDALSHYGRTLEGKYLLSRNGGDEFVMFLYDYPDDDTLLRDIHAIRQYQDRETVAMSGGTAVRLHFSVGYSMRKDEETYYGELFRKADERMYENKRRRKAEAGQHEYYETLIR